MKRNFLLTYESSKNRWFASFAWFDNEKEMNDFIKEYNVDVITTYKINNIEVLYERA